MSQPMAGLEATSGAEQLQSVLPEQWDALWTDPDPTPIEWSRIRRASRRLAEEPWLDARHGMKFETLVGSHQLRRSPVHRWFTYKEGFSPMLLGAVIDALKLEGDLKVVDVFGGVGTTALSGQRHPQVTEVRSVEYSPFAHFVGRVKLLWPTLDPARLRTLLPSALAYNRDLDVAVPSLAAFSNPRIFHRSTLRSLLSARDHLRGLPGALPPERDFLLLGLAAVVEDLSGAMKDGRALRIKGGRRRRPSSLGEHPTTLRTSGRVKRALAGQWTAMIEDLERLSDQRGAAAATPTCLLRGDARHLDSAWFPDGWGDLACFSPPYLNCLDYTELYKLELWLLEHITSQAEFRETRLGTLRSHPSLRFPSRPYFEGEEGDDIALVDEMATWVRRHGNRPEVGPIIRDYFEDMLQVWREQRRVLRPGGVAVCVVANSTFARRDSAAKDQREERWRLPLMTDVLLAHMARRAGFEAVRIWPARELRPRNTRAGRARESLVVAFAGQ